MASVSVELLPDGPAADVLAAIEAADAAGLDTAFNVRRGAEKAPRDWRPLELCASLTSAVSEGCESARIAARTKATSTCLRCPVP